MFFPYLTFIIYCFSQVDGYLFQYLYWNWGRIFYLHFFVSSFFAFLQLEKIKKAKGPSVESGTISRDKSLAAVLAENKAKKEEEFANVWKTMKQGSPHFFVSRMTSLIFVEADCHSIRKPVELSFQHEVPCVKNEEELVNPKKTCFSIFINTSTPLLTIANPWLKTESTVNEHGFVDKRILIRLGKIKISAQCLNEEVRQINLILKNSSDIDQSAKHFTLFVGKNRPLDEDDMSFVNSLADAEAAKESSLREKERSELEAYQQVRASFLVFMGPLCPTFVILKVSYFLRHCVLHG